MDYKAELAAVLDQWEDESTGHRAAEVFAEKRAALGLPARPITRCTVPPLGWTCSRTPGHHGPCAARKAGHE